MKYEPTMRANKMPRKGAFARSGTDIFPGVHQAADDLKQPRPAVYRDADVKMRPNELAV